MFADLMEKLDKIEPLLSLTGDEELKIGASFLADRIENPNSYVTFLGETSCGKSTLINGLLGRKVLSVKASPTTGAITEIELCSENEDCYFAIEKNATVERISAQTFTNLCEKPDASLERIKLRTYSPNQNMMNMRIFDTPGYGSIVEEHEEILKEFLPNSDVIIYTVSYKIGIQEEDYSFLGFLGELIREDTEIVLVINFCPSGINSNNRRIKEIQRYISGILGRTPRLFCVPFIRTENEDEYPLPKAEELWEYVSSIVNSPEHISRLHDAFDSYVCGLYKSCDAIISMNYAQSCMDEKTIKDILEAQRKTAKNIRNAIPELIVPKFNKISERLPELFDRAASNIVAKVNSEIDNSNVGRMDEMITYINSHSIPFSVKMENREINSYLELELTDLNERVNDYINKEIADFSNDVSVRLNSYTEDAVKNVSGKLFARLTTNGLKGVFSAFGGAGGANAGIANAASHLLKKIGDLFGKTFSRETHNALKHFLAKIGATSMKAVGAAISVIIELLMVAYQYATWKPKLQKKIGEAIDNWKCITLSEALTEIEKLKQENIDNITNIADEMEKCFSDDVNLCSNDWKSAAQLSETIGKKLGVI